MRVYAPESNKKVMLKLEDGEFPNIPEKFKEVAVLTGSPGWQTLNFDFSGADHSVDYNKASIFFDFYSDATGSSHPGKVYYFDNVNFGGAVLG